MKKVLLLLRVSLYILFIGNAAAQQKTTMYVNGRDIYTACDEKVVLRGINEMFIWSGNRTGSTLLPQIAKTGANSVRLVWNATGSVSELDQLIGNCINNKMIPMPEMHDATGNFSNLQKCLDYWKKPDVLAVVQKYKKWILVNIANEVGGGQETDQQYINYYKDAITQLRNAGIDVPLVIDAGGWGNNERYIVNSSVALMSHDPLHNLIFSIHTYWMGSDQETRFDKLISDMKSRNMPFIIGEGPQKVASPSACTASFPYLAIINKCQQEGIGWLSWSWGAVDNSDCGAPNSAFDITTNGTYGSWVSSFGEELCVTATNSIQKTSVRPPSLLNGTCSNNTIIPIVSLTSPSNGSSVCQGTSVTINASASISSGSVSKVDFYDGSILLGTDNTSPYSYTWNNPSAGVHTIRAIATSALNVTSAEASASVTINTPTVIEPYMQINGGNWGAQSSAQLCEGSQIGIGPHPVEASGWTWTGPNSFTASIREIQFPKINVSQGGEYIATYKDSKGCTSSAKIMVTVNAKPKTTILSPSGNSIISDANLTINANVAGTGISNVKFYSGNTILGQDPTYPYTYTWNNIPDGTYTLYVTSTNNTNCSDTASTQFTVSQVTSMKESFLPNGISCYPNPFSDTFTIKAPKSFSYLIYNQSGSEVEKGASDHPVSLGQQLKAGTYVVIIQNGNEQYTVKVTKF